MLLHLRVELDSLEVGLSCLLPSTWNLEFMLDNGIGDLATLVESSETGDLG